MVERTEKSPAQRRFKYQKEDFGPMPAVLEHLTLHISFTGEKVETVCVMRMIAAAALDEMELDAKDLEIESVELVSCADGAGSKPLEFEYRRDRDKLAVFFPAKIFPGQRFFLRTRSRCTPTEHILEGIYKDSTPPGAPQQYISQCQQWGFQRITPIFDDCRAKCTMTTTIEASAGYTHLVSNGNVDRRANPDGRPVLKPGDPTRQVITYDNPVPMAPYLFFVAAGTWDMLVDEVAYPSGRKVRLEYLVPPGAVDEARVPMAILKDSVLWVQKTQDYEYEFDTYRTICMTKSNFGGMENLGNTTIVTDAALITGHTLDHLLLYAHAVIVHEFEHNQCGSETTMDTPFDVWLNEAYTVDVERQFMADFFDPSFVRLQQVDSIRAPLLGPLTIEDAGHFGRIVREGFNDPDELIDGVTYVKAAEVIRMLRLVIGEEAFHEGKALYFSRYRASNADTDQFFECFEETSGTSLTRFKSEWLYRIGYPKVKATARHDPGTGRFHVKFTQQAVEGKNPFVLPVSMALVDEQGRDIEGTERVVVLRDFETETVFEGVKGPGVFASMNRDSSFYGTFFHENVDAAALSRQARLDPNSYNRVDAMRKLTDIERLRLLLEPAAEISEGWLELYWECLSDRSIPASLKAYFLRVDEQPMDRAYATWYPELVAARERLMKGVNSRYRDALVNQFLALGSSDAGSMRQGIEDRMLKGVLLDLAVIDDSKESHSLILDCLGRAHTATERVSALTALNRSSEPSRKAVLEEYYGKWHAHLSGYANYLRAVSSGTNAGVFGEIEAEKRRTSFDINQPTWCRALFLTMAGNNKMVWTDEGIEWVASTVIALVPVNPTTAGRLLNTFQHVASLKPGLKEKAASAIGRVARLVAEKACPSVHGQATAYLKGL